MNATNAINCIWFRNACEPIRMCLRAYVRDRCPCSSLVVLLPDSDCFPCTSMSEPTRPNCSVCTHVFVCALLNGLRDITSSRCVYVVCCTYVLCCAGMSDSCVYCIFVPIISCSLRFASELRYAFHFYFSFLFVSFL